MEPTLTKTSCEPVASLTAMLGLQACWGLRPLNPRYSKCEASLRFLVQCVPKYNTFKY